MIECHGLYKAFADRQVIEDVGFSVKPGSVTALLGPNGAGKTTTMRMLSGYLRPDQGSASIAGHDVQSQPLAARRKLGYLPEGAPAWAEMTPAQLLAFASSLHQLDASQRQARIAWLNEHLGLDAVLHQRFDTLSKGFRRRVGFALALLHDPDVLVLDEPTDGLDPNQKAEVRRLIQQLAPQKAILISTHILEEVEAMCDRVVLLAHGRVVEDSTPQDLRMRSAHFGCIRLAVLDADIATAKQVLAKYSHLHITESTQPYQLSLQAVNTPEAIPSVAEVLRTLQAAGVSVQHIEQDKGRLDDVFFALTQKTVAGETSTEVSA